MSALLVLSNTPSGRLCGAPRFPIPPVRTVRAAFTAHGSREAGITACFPFIDSMESTMVSVCLRQLPWYSCLPAPLGAFAMYVAFLRSDYYAPSDCLEGLGNFETDLSSLLSTFLTIPVRLSRVRHVRLKRTG